MEKLPTMTYQVGEQSACCAKSAEKLAEKLGEKVQFVVAGKSYGDKVTAMTALADETEKFVNEFATPKTCSVSHKTTVAGQSMECSEKAAAIAKTIHDAMETVTVAFKVGDKTCSCPMQAAALAKEANQPKETVVGDDSTCCPVEARILVAHARYKAALEALAKLSAEQEETKPVSTQS